MDIRIEIRAANEDDIEEVIRIWTAFYEDLSSSDSYFEMQKDEIDRIPRLLRDNLKDEEKNYLKVAFMEEGGDRMIAFISGSSFGGDVFLDNIVVEEEFRGKGVGKSMFSDFLEWSKRKEVPRIVLKVSSLNARAIRFFGSLGFSEIVHYMQRRLS